MTTPKTADEIQLAFEQIEHVFGKYKNEKARQSNVHPAGSSSRIEADLSEIEKAHLALLQSKLAAVIAQQQLRSQLESSNSSDRLGRKLYWLNVFVAALTTVMAASSVLELVCGRA